MASLIERSSFCCALEGAYFFFFKTKQCLLEEATKKAQDFVRNLYVLPVKDMTAWLTSNWGESESEGETIVHRSISVNGENRRKTGKALMRTEIEEKVRNNHDELDDQTKERKMKQNKNYPLTTVNGQRMTSTFMCGTYKDCGKRKRCKKNDLFVVKRY